MAQTSGGGGSGTVTSVDLLGTANQITVTGASPITTSGSWTLSIPTNPTLPGTTTGTFSGNLTGAASLNLLTSNNLSDVTAATARTNLGLGALATVTPGTGIATALGVNVGSAGAPVVLGGALGTPASGTGTNITGIPNANVLGLGSAALISSTAGGDLTGTLPSPTVIKLNGTTLSGLATGILKNTTGTGVPSIAVAGDFPTLNQNTSGTASNVTGIVASPNGGTGVNNGTSTLTLAESLATAGAFNATLTFTNTTGVTFPTTGTLATLAGVETFTNKTSTNPSWGVAPSGGNIAIPNEGATGTTVNKLAKLTGAPSTAIIAGTGDTDGEIGIVTSGAGTTGNAQVVRDGTAACVFDGATTAGDYVQISATVAGDCHDTGATRPTSGQIIGRVLGTNGGGGTYNLTISGMGIVGVSGAVAFPATVSGTTASGGIPYFSSTTVLTSSALLGANNAVFGGGAGAAPFSSASVALTNVGATNETLTIKNNVASGITKVVIDPGASQSTGNPLLTLSSTNTNQILMTMAGSGNFSQVSGTSGLVYDSPILLGGGNSRFYVGATGPRLSSIGTIGWTASDPITGPTATDVALERVSAGVLAVYSTQAQGTTAANFRALELSAHYIVGTTFTLSTNGCGADTLAGGATGGTFVSRTSGACTGIVTMGNSATAPTGWHCTFNDRSSFLDVGEAASTTTTAQFSITTLTGEVISFTCTGF
jgi:hypothetical protein